MRGLISRDPFLPTPNAKLTGAAPLPRPVERLISRLCVPPREVFKRRSCSELHLRTHLLLEQYRTRDAGEDAPNHDKQRGHAPRYQKRETNQRNGSSWLFLGIALVVGFAMGAGYVSYKTSS